MRRRRLLAVLGTMPLAGCSGWSSDGFDNDTLVRTEQHSASEDAIIIPFGELPDEEQNICQTALDEEFYHVCSEPPEAVHSFVNRLEDNEPHLEYEDTEYALWVRIRDQVYATTASPPEDSPGCGRFN